MQIAQNPHTQNFTVKLNVKEKDWYWLKIHRDKTHEQTHFYTRIEHSYNHKYSIIYNNRRIKTNKTHKNKYYSCIDCSIAL